MSISIQNEQQAMLVKLSQLQQQAGGGAIAPAVEQGSFGDLMKNSVRAINTESAPNPTTTIKLAIKCPSINPDTAGTILSPAIPALIV